MTAPLPPPDLESRTPKLIEIPSGTEFHRFHNAAFSPIYFDKSEMGRFNSPDGTYGVLYAAKTTKGAFAETFLRSPGKTVIDAGLLRNKAYVSLIAKRDLILIQMAGPGLARIGATAEVTHSGLPYTVPQTWSAALLRHRMLADGIAYHSRHDDSELCYALFDRTSDTISDSSRKTDLDHDWLWEIAALYGVGLAPEA